MEAYMNTIIISVVLLGVLGIAIGLLLGVAGKFFAVEVDERVDLVLSLIHISEPTRPST